MLYKFENDRKNFGCVGSCGYAPASVKSKRTFYIESTEYCADSRVMYPTKLCK